MKIKLAGADFTFPILPHDQVLQLISLLGIKGMDVGSPPLNSPTSVAPRAG